MLQRSLFLGLLCLALLNALGCSQTQSAFNNLNLFPVADDVKLGRQVAAEIAANPAKYPVIPEGQNPQAYQYVRKIKDRILNSGKVKHRNVFPWEIKLIRDDNTANAFCTPGGYIYIYTGLIKLLDSEDELAGVLGHEMAHADLRHSTRQMTKSVGLSVIAEVLLGNNQQLIQDVALGIIGLKFSREHEAEADDQSVNYLCGSDYNAAGAAEFFKKIKGAARPPAFLSTHPDPENRIVDIAQRKVELGCKGSATYDAEYARFKALF